MTWAFRGADLKMEAPQPNGAVTLRALTAGGQEWVRREAGPGSELNATGDGLVVEAKYVSLLRRVAYNDGLVVE